MFIASIFLNINDNGFGFIIFLFVTQYTIYLLIDRNIMILKFIELNLITNKGKYATDRIRESKI